MSRVVVLEADELAELVENAVRRALDARSSEPAPEPSEWLDTRGAAELLGVSSRTVSNYARSGALPSSRIGRLLRFRRSDLEAFLAGDT